MARRQSARPLPRRSLISLLDAAQQGVEKRRAWSHPTGSAETVDLPPLATGRHMLERIPIREEPDGAQWDATEYQSVTPWICEFRNALVHNCAGIIAVGGEVVADTLAHTSGALNRYEETTDGIRLHRSGDVERLRGAWLSLLGANHGNYYHWTLDCLARLAAADPATLATCANVLVPPLDAEFQATGFALTGLQRTHAIRTMARDATVEVERLFVPWTITGVMCPHPCIRGYFDRLAAAAPPSPGPWPRRFYVDRRASPNRRLANEEEAIAALTRMGFAPMRLEDLPLAGQIALFRNAETIVAPHGAGLANIVYAHPGCRLVELHMDSYVNWCFRRLAAVCQVSYDCVIGRQLPATGAGTIHGQQWAVPITHMLGAVEQALARTG